MRRPRLAASSVAAVLLPRPRFATPAASTATAAPARDQACLRARRPEPDDPIAPNRAIVCKWTAPTGLDVSATYRLWRSVNTGTRHLIATVAPTSTLRHADRNIRTAPPTTTSWPRSARPGPASRAQQRRVASTSARPARPSRFNCVVVIDDAPRRRPACHWAEPPAPAAVRYVLWRSVDGGPRQVVCTAPGSPATGTSRTRPSNPARSFATPWLPSTSTAGSWPSAAPTPCASPARRRSAAIASVDGVTLGAVDDHRDVEDEQALVGAGEGRPVGLRRALPALPSSRVCVHLPPHRRCRGGRGHHLGRLRACAPQPRRVPVAGRRLWTHGCSGSFPTSWWTTTARRAAPLRAGAGRGTTTQADAPDDPADVVGNRDSVEEVLVAMDRLNRATSRRWRCATCQA